MTDQANGAASKPPTLSIQTTEAHGADPTGIEGLILIRSATGQMVQLHLPSVEAAADFLQAVRGTLNQMRQNARKAGGDDMVTAIPAAKFSVGHVQGIDGTLLALDPDTPNESMFVLGHQMACDVGQMLVMEAGKRMRLQQAIKAGSGAQVMAPRRRILRPGEH